MREGTKHGLSAPKKSAQFGPGSRFQIEDEKIIWSVPEMREDGLIVPLIDLHEVASWFRQGIITAIDKTKHRVVMTLKMANQTLGLGGRAAPGEDEF